MANLEKINALIASYESNLVVLRKLFMTDGVLDPEEQEKINQVEALLAKVKLQTNIDDAIESTIDGHQEVKLKIQQLGEPNKVKPEYKGVNFDYQANAEKIRHYNNNLTDGGHYYGSDYKIAGMVHLYKQPTHEATYRVICRFADAAQINVWNNELDNCLGNVNAGKSIAIGLLTTFIPVAKMAKWAGLGVQLLSGAISGTAGILDYNFLTISPVQVGLSSKYQLTTESKIKTIRSSGSGDKYNGVEISISIRVETLSGKLVEEATSFQFFKELDPFGNSKFDHANDQVLRLFEEYESYEEIVGPEQTCPYLIKFLHRD